jgi:hypothetical protein
MLANLQAVRPEPVEAFFASFVRGLPTSRVSPRRATYFSLLRQRNLRKRKATRWFGSLRFATGNLRCSSKMGSSSNSPSAQTIARPDPFSAELLGPARRVAEEEKHPNTNTEFNPESLKRAALQGRESQQTDMFAHERSTRGQMRLPSLAQRGEGRAGGWEWGVKVLLSQAYPGAAVCRYLPHDALSLPGEISSR